jgi:hypothetical protein
MQNGPLLGALSIFVKLWRVPQLPSCYSEDTNAGGLDGKSLSAIDVQILTGERR